MDNELYFNGQKYISSKRAAEETGYTNDYIGQLCRAGKVEGRLIGRTRFIEEKSILAYKKMSEKEQKSSNAEDTKNIDAWSELIFGKSGIRQNSDNELENKDISPERVQDISEQRKIKLNVVKRDTNIPVINKKIKTNEVDEKSPFLSNWQIGNIKSKKRLVPSPYVSKLPVLFNKEVLRRTAMFLVIFSLVTGTYFYSGTQDAKAGYEKVAGIFVEKTIGAKRIALNSFNYAKQNVKYNTANSIHTISNIYERNIHELVKLPKGFNLDFEGGVNRTFNKSKEFGLAVVAVRNNVMEKVNTTFTRNGSKSIVKLEVPKTEPNNFSKQYYPLLSSYVNGLAQFAHEIALVEVEYAGIAKDAAVIIADMPIDFAGEMNNTYKIVFNEAKAVSKNLRGIAGFNVKLSGNMATVFSKFTNNVSGGLRDITGKVALSVYSTVSGTMVVVADGMEIAISGTGEIFANLFRSETETGIDVVVEVERIEKGKISAKESPSRESHIGLTSVEPVGRRVAPVPANTNQAAVQTGSQGRLPQPILISSSGISNAQLEERLNQLDNTLRGEIYRLIGSSNTSNNIQTVYRTVSLTNKIDNLTGVTISDATVSGVSGLTDSDVPDDVTASNYLPLIGGTLTGALTGTDATFSGGLTLSGSSISNGISSSGQITTTFAPTTTPHTFSSWAPDVAGANATSAALVINSSSSAADTNLFGVAVDGNAKFLIDAEGDVYANSITASGGVTLSTTTASTFLVENNTTLGDATTTDIVYFNSRIGTSLIPTADNVLDIGDGANNLSWRNGYFAGSIGIGTTSPYAKLSVVGETVAEYFTATSTSATSTFPWLSATRSNLGTIIGGTWNGSTIDEAYGGTGTTSPYQFLYGDGTNFTSTSTIAQNFLDSALARTVDVLTLSNWFGTTTAPQLTTLEGVTNLIATNSTSTNATTTNLFSTTASSTNLFTSNLSIASLSGFLKATAGAVATALIDLTADVTGVLPDANVADDIAIDSSTVVTAPNFVADSASATSTFAGGLAIETSGLVYDYSSGNVGIGTAAPDGTLHVQTSSSGASAHVNGDDFIIDNSGATGMSILGGTASSLRLMFGDSDNNYAGSIEYENSNNAMTFRTSNSEKLRIDSNGNVGIGTTSPYAKLSVVGETVAEYFTATSTTATSTFAGGLAIETSGFVYDYSSNNVGIASSSPLAKLDVYGDMILSGQNRYLNFDYTTGTNGYGIRDNAGTLEYKNSGGSWAGIGSGGGGASADWQKETNYGGLTLTPTTTIPIWAKDAIYASSTLNVDGLTTLGNASSTQLTVTGPAYFNSSTTFNGVEYLYPSADGSNAQVLTSNGAGGLSWSTVSQGTTISPSFFAHNNGSTQTIGTGSATKLVFSNEDFDTNGDFDLTNERFTPTVAGKYILVASSGFALGDTDIMIVYIYKNGSSVAEQRQTISGAPTTVGQVSVIVDANGTTDYFEAFVWHNYGSDKNTEGSANRTFFTGSRIDGGGLWTDGGTTSYLATSDLVGVGTSTAYSALTVWGDGTGTGQAFEVVNNASTTLFSILDNGSIGIATTSPLAKLDVYGDMILSGQNRYLNFDYTTGTNGYGIRDNAGTLQFKNSGGSWTGLNAGTDTVARNNIMLNAFRIAANGSLGDFKIQDAIIDEFEDETGVDTATSTNQTYDSTGDFYDNSSQIIIPQGTGTAIGDMIGGGGLAAGFDGNKSQATAASAQLDGSPTVAYIGKDWGSGVTKTVTGVKAWGSTDEGFGQQSGTFTITLQGSTDNFSSSVVDLGNWSFTDPNDNTEQNKLSGFTETTAYRYHRIKIVPPSAGRIVAAEVEFYEDIGSDMILYSATTTAETQPDEARIVVLHENNSTTTVTVNTDIKAWVTRAGDNGDVANADWTQITLTDEGSYSSTTKIFIGSADISGQTASTSMRWKVETFNDLKQRIHGVALRWGATGGADLAEWFKVGDGDLDEDGESVIEDGEILCTDTTDNEKVIRCAEPNSDNILGIASTDPGLTIGASYKGGDAVKLALTGRVPVKVNLDGGEIEIGDKITSSIEAGFGMKATSTGRTIGIALEPFNASSTVNTVIAFIDPSWSFGESSTASTSSSVSSFANSVISIVLKGLASLGVKIADGIAYFNDLVVEGLASVGSLIVGTPEKPSGITLYDKVTGEPYCLSISNGEMTSAQGECDSVSTDEINTEAPVITINGNNPAEIEIGSVYSDLGAIVTDDKNDNLGYKTSVNGVEVEEVSIDTSEAGEYSITYTATDQEGNVGTAERVVIVSGANIVEQTATTTPAVIEDNPIVEEPEPVIEETATTTPEVVLDTTPPTITLTGQAIMEITGGDVYIDEGASAEDDTDGDITANIIISNTVDTSVPNTYTVTYNVQDQAGNQADEISRTITVLPLPEPMIEETATTTSETM